MTFGPDLKGACQTFTDILSQARRNVTNTKPSVGGRVNHRLYNPTNLTALLPVTGEHLSLIQVMCVQ